MFVVATAGHVDHGKSTLVRALTGMEPDRWDEERKRGLTIDLGYAWTELPELAEPVAFVDVPGHRRFIGNMLAGLGPAPAVLLVIAADEGWRAQTSEHMAAIDALGVRHGLVAVTRCDLADPTPALAEASDRLAETSLAGAPMVAVSARTGQGLGELRATLAAMCSALPQPDSSGRTRLWVDRSFTMRGSGTVVTGTLVQGQVGAGTTLLLGDRPVQVRGVQALGRPVPEVAAVARAALNLRGVEVDEVCRGDALVSEHDWQPTQLVDARLASGAARDLPAEVDVNVGTASVRARVRPLDAAALRLTLGRALPLQRGERLLLRDPGHESAIIGATVVDSMPPPLVRRGDARRRAAVVLAATDEHSLADEVSARGVLTRAQLRSLGHAVPDVLPANVVRVDEYMVDRGMVAQWSERVLAVVDAHAAAHPMEPAMPVAAVTAAADTPSDALTLAVAAQAGLHVTGGRVARPGMQPTLGDKQTGLDGIKERLAANAFAAPEQPDLDAAGLGPREVAAAVATGQLVRLGGDILLLPNAPAHAMRVLAQLPQPFTTSQARQALKTTRRVAIPLLEHLDAKGWTRRIDTALREVVR